MVFRNVAKLKIWKRQKKIKITLVQIRREETEFGESSVNIKFLNLFLPVHELQTQNVILKSPVVLEGRTPVSRTTGQI